MKNYILLILWVIMSGNLFGIDGTGSVVSGGILRTFAYHAPGAVVAANLPVFIIMHGDGGTGAQMKVSTGFDNAADVKNFIAIYPNAVNGDWNRAADDASGDACTGSNNPNDDVLFISELIDYLCNTYHINNDKVYATGHSAGGFMAYNLAIQLTSRIAAFAPVSASLCGDDKFITAALKANGPVPIYHVHGDADRDANGVEYPDIDNTANYEWPLSAFSQPNCGADSYSKNNTIVTGVIEHVYCEGAKKISLIQIVGMGHAWPNVAGYNAADAIAAFCLQYSLNTGKSCAPNSVKDNNISSGYEIFPNPSSGQFEITSDNLASVKACDVFGNEIAVKKLQNNVYEFQNAVSGVYIIKATDKVNQIFFKKIIIR